MYDNRRYVIFDVSELGMVDFDQVMETSAETVRKSVDGLKTFVKYVNVMSTPIDPLIPESFGVMPSSIAALTTKSQEYSHEEILTILSGVEWSKPMPLI